MEHEAAAIKLALPVSVVTHVDISRLLRELESVEDLMKAATVRTPGATVKLSKVSKMLEDTAQTNKLNLLVADDRQKLQTFLLQLKDHAPMLHMSFSSEPGAQFLQKLITWLRKEINPQLVLQIGLQPTIAAGCIVRTDNKYFDFSLRKNFQEKQEMLIELIGGRQDYGHRQ